PPTGRVPPRTEARETLGSADLLHQVGAATYPAGPDSVRRLSSVALTRRGFCDGLNRHSGCNGACVRSSGTNALHLDQRSSENATCLASLIRPAWWRPRSARPLSPALVARTGRPRRPAKALRAAARVYLSWRATLPFRVRQAYPDRLRSRQQGQMWGAERPGPATP